MKKIILVLFLLIFFSNHPFSETIGADSNTQENKVSRKEELILEGFINDYFYRRKIKDPSIFGSFNAYGSVLANSIVIYVYAKDNKNTNRNWLLWKNEIHEGLQSTLLDFEDFKWAQKYSFSVVLRKI